MNIKKTNREIRRAKYVTTTTVKRCKEFFTVSDGNYKLVSNEDVLFQIFNLPCIKTCPFATPHCIESCYAVKSETNPQRARTVKASRERNYTFSQSDDFAPTMIEYLKIKLNNLSDGRKIIFRIHESGDFYSKEYAMKWLEIARFFKDDERITFTAYTKSIEFFKDEEWRGIINLRFSLWDDTDPKQVDLALKMGLPIYTAVKSFMAVAVGMMRKFIARFHRKKSPVDYSKYFRCRCSDCATCQACYSDKVKVIACEIH